jgi:hypothetical protein
MSMQLDLSKLSVGESTFVPSLRTTRVLGDANRQAVNLRLSISYRLTVVDGKYGVLLTRQAKGPAGLTNEDRKAS